MPSLLAPEELLRRLISFETVSAASNRALVDFICNLLDRPDARISELAPQDDKSNLLIELGPADASERRGLLLCGHLDVVPAQEPAWHHDPFTLQSDDQGFSGRGTADMKGFVALAVDLLARVEVQRLQHPLALLLTRDEETGTQGARDLVQGWGQRAPLPRSTVIGEPTQLAVVRLHKGHASFRLRCFGRSAHSGYPQLGINAIALAARALTALEALRAELATERTASSAFFPQVPFVPLNVGTIAGGAAINVVPELCTIELGLRALPGMDTNALFERVHGSLAQALPAGSYQCELLQESPPLELSAETPIHQHLCALVGQQGSQSVSYATDGGWLRLLDQDCVICGPGSIEVAHKANERLPRADFVAAGELLERLLQRECLTA